MPTLGPPKESTATGGAEAVADGPDAELLALVPVSPSQFFRFFILDLNDKHVR